MVRMINKNHPIYDEIHVDEISTSGKVVEEFSNQIMFRRNGKPEVWILKHDISEFDSNEYKVKQKVCPICVEKGENVYVPNPRIENDKTWIGTCSKCGAGINFFTPTPLQQIIRNINMPIINVISGYGSGKTEFDMWYAARRALQVDGSRIMIAFGTSALAKNVKGFLSGHFKNPERYSKKENPTGDFLVKNEEMWKLRNGSEIIFINADSPQVEKFRSWELDLVIMVEASSESFFKGGNTSFWNEIKTRMRNAVGNVYAKDLNDNMFDYITEGGRVTPFSHGSIHQIMLESNPKNSDIIQEVFDKSQVLILTDKVANKDKIIKKFLERYDQEVNGKSGIVTILASSNDNPMLTEKYLKNAFPPGTSPAKIARMRDADLSRNEGQVWQKAQDNRVPRLSSEIIKTADRIYQIFDPGTVHPSATLYAAVWKNFEKTGKPKVHIFHAHKTKGGASKEGNTIHEITGHFDETEIAYTLSMYDPVNHKINRKYIHPITGKAKRIIRVADNAMWKSEKAGDEIVQDHTNEAEKYRLKGFDFKQALKGKNSIEYGIQLVDTYWGENILEYSNDLEDFENEIIKYEYVPNSKGELIPREVDNHLMDDVRYLVFEVDNYLKDTGNQPEILTGDGAKIREAMERRKVLRDNRYNKDIDRMQELGLISRTEQLELNNMKTPGNKWK